VSKPVNKTVLRWIATIVLLAIVAWLIGREVVASWQRLAAYEFSLSWPLVALSVALGAGYYFFNSQAWRYAVQRSGQRVSVAQAYRLYALSVFGRYVPGKAWLALIRMELGARLGISRTATTVALLYENGLQLTTGVAISAVLGASLFAGHGRAGLLAVLAAVLCLVVLAPPVFYRLLNALLRMVRREPFDRAHQLRFGHMARMVGFFVGVWVCGGASLYLLAVALDSTLVDRPVQIGLIFVVSQVLGFVALFAPGGLGVREWVQMELLMQITTPEQAIILPFLARLALVAAEVIQGAILQAALTRAHAATSGPAEQGRAADGQGVHDP